MKTKHSALAMCTLLLAGLFLYQNCGPQQADPNALYEHDQDSVGPDDDSNGGLGDGVKKETSNTSTFAPVVGDSISLAASASTYAAFMDGSCLWTFTNTSNVVSNVSNPSRILTISNIEKNQSGTYRLTCENATMIHSFIFKVSVGDTPVGPSPSPTPTPTPGTPTPTPTPVVKATLYGYYKNKLYKTVTNLTAEQALARCKKEAGSNRGVKCVWNGQTIWSQ